MSFIYDYLDYFVENILNCCGFYDPVGKKFLLEKINV